MPLSVPCRLRQVCRVCVSIQDMDQRARLLAAAKQNDVETLKELLDSPKWYEVGESDGNLLQIAILRESNAVFDYLLSLDDFPLEAVDDQGATALVMALSYYTSNYTWMSDRYAYELIKKGADIDKISPEGQPLLHCALERDFVRVARLLVERGADVNQLNHRGATPLHMCSPCGNVLNFTEALTMLLCHGADPSICDNDSTVFDNIVSRGGDGDMLVALENLFFFSVDELSSFKIRCETLLLLAQNRSPLFHQVIKFTSGIIYCERHLESYSCRPSCSSYLFSIDSEYLEIFLEKYPYWIQELLQSYSGFSLGHMRTYTFNLKNFDILMQSSFNSDTIEFISKLNNREVIRYILGSGKNIDESMGIIYYLLSYGMSLDETDLECIYKKTGYSEDFKNLLFMDYVEKQFHWKIREIMPRLIYDVTLDIHKSVEDPAFLNFIVWEWEEIFSYFVHPKIQNAYRQIKSNEVPIGKQLPQVPLLQELARDAFRKYFVKKFKISTAKQFYSLMKSLPISSALKKILTFESKLY